MCLLMFCGLKINRKSRVQGSVFKKLCTIETCQDTFIMSASDFPAI
jgi:hypothetical protein